MKVDGELVKLLTPEERAAADGEDGENGEDDSR